MAFPARFLFLITEDLDQIHSTWVHTELPPWWVPLESPVCSLHLSPQITGYESLLCRRHCVVHICVYFLIIS